jgi:hypothetical protein
MGFEERIAAARKEKSATERAEAERLGSELKAKRQRTAKAAHDALPEVHEAIAALRRRRASSEVHLRAHRDDPKPWYGVRGTFSAPPRPSRQLFAHPVPDSRPALAGWTVSLTGTSADWRVFVLTVPVAGDAWVDLSGDGAKNRPGHLALDDFAERGFFIYEITVGDHEQDQREALSADGLREFAAKILDHLVALPGI